MATTKYKDTHQNGEELYAYLPKGKLAEIDRVRGPYLTRSKFVLLAIDEVLKSKDSKLALLAELEGSSQKAQTTGAVQSCDSSEHREMST